METTMETKTGPDTLGAPGELKKTADGGTERGKSLSIAEGGVLDVSEDNGLESVTTAVPERGEFEIVGGYVDPDTKARFNGVELRSMRGEEEDLLGVQSMSITQRLTNIMAGCTVRLSTTDKDEDGNEIPPIEEPNAIRNAIFKMPSGSRVHLLISLRRTTHWKRHKDVYEMIVKCPNPSCRKESTHGVDLGKLDVFEMPDPNQMTYEVDLLDAGTKVSWKVATGEIDQVLSIVSSKAEEDILTYAIAVRLHAFDGKPLRLGMSDWLDSKKTRLELSRRAQTLIDIVKKWSSGDRGDLRADFEDKEPAVDTTLEFTCTHCREEFVGHLDVAQRSFFFPSVISKRSNRKRST